MFTCTWIKKATPFGCHKTSLTFDISPKGFHQHFIHKNVQLHNTNILLHYVTAHLPIGTVSNYDTFVCRKRYAAIKASQLWQLPFMIYVQSKLGHKPKKNTETRNKSLFATHGPLTIHDTTKDQHWPNCQFNRRSLSKQTSAYMINASWESLPRSNISIHKKSTWKGKGCDFARCMYVIKHHESSYHIVFKTKYVCTIMDFYHDCKFWK